jgi:hypothetical protein
MSFGKLKWAVQRIVGEAHRKIYEVPWIFFRELGLNAIAQDYPSMGGCGVAQHLVGLRIALMSAKPMTTTW